MITSIFRSTLPLSLTLLRGFSRVCKNGAEVFLVTEFLCDVNDFDIAIFKYSYNWPTSRNGLKKDCVVNTAIANGTFRADSR